MARAFSESEKEHIQQRLIDVGRDLFARYGLKKTSLEDLTSPVGIARSSFYLFFDSKEALYLHLLNLEREQVTERVMGASFYATDDMREAIARFIRAVVQEIETNALTRRLVTHPDEMQQFARSFSPEQLAAKNRDSLALIQPYIERGQAAGQIVAGSSEIIAGVIRAVTLLTLHKENIGEHAYPHVLEMMTDLVASGLTTRDS